MSYVEPMGDRNDRKIIFNFFSNHSKITNEMRRGKKTKFNKVLIIQPYFHSTRSHTKITKIYHKLFIDHLNAMRLCKYLQNKSWR